MYEINLFEPPASARSYGTSGNVFFQHSSNACACIQKQSIWAISGLLITEKPFQNASKASSRTDYRKQRLNDERARASVHITNKDFNIGDRRSISVYQVQCSTKLETAEAVVIFSHMGSFDGDSFIDAYTNDYPALLPRKHLVC